MNRKFIVFLGISVIAALLFSCVGNRKILLLQSTDTNDRATLNTPVRTYPIDTFNYKVQPNDIISVKFESLTTKDYDFLSANSPPASGAINLSQGGSLLIGELVDERGQISFPVVGKVTVAGLTVFGIQDKLQGLASAYVKSPVVKVRLLNYRVTLLGEVNKEGTVFLSTNRVSLLEAIGLAGGLGELADRSNVKLIRQRDGHTEVIYLNLLDEKFLTSPYYFVYQNDVVIVPPLKQRPFRKYFAQNLAVFVSGLSLLITIALLKK